MILCADGARLPTRIGMEGSSIQPRTWAMMCHLAGLLGYVTGGLGSVFGPLILWLVKRDSIPEVDHHGREALNFNITMMAVVVLLFGVAVVGSPLALRELHAIVIALVVLAFHVTFIVVATRRASRGVAYRYPVAVRIVR